ncbi:hypothetical protein Asulf_02234 [Archaeoglobus sulfaticallidus PM70-1]|uniref:S-adenosyl-l-methionine hydroxide adenosyltransferase n=1 Tax=Archaeoglobus sulfaticallidus PM70-1 TaxID=387631 RepID=N0BIN6_9EURY|nr:SAM-dependent chlorinase/fluorinase [Archaeoglobus sulfaticallidus]AGK62187.1 hypothetical protein Asulf_02234 [Archaeoglobus sulfaticallidus PM70-1]
MRIITLLTDFGEFYPGVMKGVILRLCPDVTIVDITHSVDPQNTLQAAFLLNSYHRFFENAIHVAVVDPGVGSEREALIVERGNIFIAPNNGILTPVLDSKCKIWKIDESKASRFVGTLSSTFHGRDVFAPAAALAALNMIEEIAEPFEGRVVRLDLFNPEIIENRIKCNVAYIDRFGNIVTDLRREAVRKLNPKGFYLKDTYFPLVEKYADVDLNEPLSLIGSFDTLEFSIRNGNASKVLGIGYGKLEFEAV